MFVKYIEMIQRKEQKKMPSRHWINNTKYNILYAIPRTMYVDKYIHMPGIIIYDIESHCNTFWSENGVN